MLLSHVGYSADGRRVRGFVHARTIEGTGGVAECPLHAASPPVPGSPAGAAPSDMRGMIASLIVAPIEPLSLDEAYLDVTENLQGIPLARDVALAIRSRISESRHARSEGGATSRELKPNVR